MNAQEVGGLVRTMVAMGSGMLIARGIIDAATATAVAGALGTLATAGWSIWAKRRK